MKQLTRLFILFFVFGILVTCEKDEPKPDPEPEPEPTQISKPSSPNPANNATGINNDNVTLRWTFNDNASFNIYFGDANPPTLVQSNLNDKSFNYGELDDETKYYWQIEANLTNGTSIKSDIWNFTTAKYEAPPGFQLIKHAIETDVPSYVNIMFQVLDMDGVGVTNLQTSNFEITEDGDAVSPSESAMNIKKKDIIPYKLKTVILLDNSLSIGDDLSKIKEAAIALVNNIVEEQEIAIYEFSDSPVLKQDFTHDINLLKDAINSINLGYNSTDLYGSIITGAKRWNNIYSTKEINQGFLIVLTDGSDTQGSHSLSQAQSAIGNKNVYTIGLGDEIDPDVLKKLGTSGFYSVTNINNLSNKFTEIQDKMIKYANSFYWLNYLSPKRGSNYHDLVLKIKNNVNTGSNSQITGRFNSSGFYSVKQGLFINPDAENKEGIESIVIAENDTLLLNAVTYFGNNTPSYEWSVDDESIIKVNTVSDDKSQANLIAVGDSGMVSNLKVKDVSNNLEKTLVVNVITSYVSTLSATEIEKTSAVLNGVVNSDGGSALVNRGFYWSESNNNPNSNDNIVLVTGNLGDYNKTISNLKSNSTYYFRAFAKNEDETLIGSVRSFKTKEDPILHISADKLEFGLEINQLSIDIKNIGNGELNWTIEENIEWLTVFPLNGETKTETDQIELTVDRNNLTQGTYKETITLKSNGGNQDVNIEIKAPFDYTILTDSRDENKYKTIKIGDQWWMAENLAYLPNVSHPSNVSLTDPLYYVSEYYASNVMEAKSSNNYKTYGVLYNWHAALTACPSGWHLPSDEEWEQLAQFVSTQKYSTHNDNYWWSVGGYLKSIGTTDDGSGLWYKDSEWDIGTDDFGFSGLPAGVVTKFQSGGFSFNHIHRYGYWWSATENNSTNAWYRAVYYTSTYFGRFNEGKNFGYSVRCVKN